MKPNYLLALLALTLAGSMSSPAEAGSIACDIPNLANLHTQTFTCGEDTDVGLSAWSNTEAFSDPADAVDLRFNNTGVGVDGGGSAQVNNGDTPFYAEWIAISSSTYIDGIGIAAANSNDDILLFASDTPDPNTATVLFNLFPGVLSGGGSSVDWFYFAPTTLYVLAGVTTDQTLNSGWRVGAVSVPEPLTLALFGTGLVAVGLRYRRRTR